ncbi:MAG TPA: tail fiber protein [Rhodopila sp.]|nr:tail fiber protein [Rhodopila sp.]
MSDPVIGEIRMFAFPKIPDGWLACDGASYPLSGAYGALYAKIGTTFGGDGSTVFSVPDMRGRTPVHQVPNQGWPLGLVTGWEEVSLNATQIPSHTHVFVASTSNGTVGTPNQQTLLGEVNNDAMYFVDTSQGARQTMSPTALGLTGGAQPHDNMMPSQVISFCIAFQGQPPPA